MKIRRILTKLPFLGLLIGITLLLIPETQVSSHDHLTHLFFAGAPLLALLFFAIWGKRPSYVSGRYTLLSLFVLFFFILHLIPSTLQFTYHHQAQSPNTDHPCCAPQLATPVAIVSVLMVETTLEKFTLAIPSSYLLVSTHPTNNKSPPLPLV